MAYAAGNPKTKAELKHSSRPVTYKVAIFERANSAPIYNAIRHATREDAERAALDLQSRWFGFHHWEVRESSDPVYPTPAQNSEE